MNSRRLISVILITGFLAACVGSQNSPKQTIGTILGAGAGAVLGSQVGDGKGRLVAVALGTLGGAFLGSEIGKTMDEVDRMKAGQTQQAALERNPVGQASSWVNPDSGNSGRITPTRTYQTARGEDCREYQHEVTIKGRTEVITGTACRNADGTWRSLN